MTKIMPEHILTDEPVCWCAPATHYEIESITVPMPNGSDFTFGVNRKMVIHEEPALLPRRHGHPRIANDIEARLLCNV